MTIPEPAPPPVSNQKQLFCAGLSLKQVFLLVLQLALLFGCCIFLATHRPLAPGDDEGLYLYDAWVQWRAQAPPSFPMLLNYGYILGLPYALFQEPGVLGFRLYSMLVWLLGVALLFYGYLHYLRGSLLLLVPSLGFVLHAMIYNQVSYLSLPFILTAVAGGLFLISAASQPRPARDLATGLGTGLAVLLSVLAYTPAILPGLLILSSAAWHLKSRKRFYQGLITGAMLGIGVLITLTPVSPQGVANFLGSSYGQGTLDLSGYGTPSQLLARSLHQCMESILLVLFFFSMGMTLIPLAVRLFKLPIPSSFPIPGILISPIAGVTAMIVIAILDSLFFKAISQTLGDPNYETLYRSVTFASMMVFPFSLMALSQWQPAKCIQLLLPVVWLFLIYLMEATLGYSSPTYYLIYLAPLLLGLTWILGSATLNSHPFRPHVKTLYHTFFIGLLCFSLLFAFSRQLHTQRFFRGADATTHLKTQTPLFDAKFRGIRLGENLTDYYKHLETAYTLSRCDTKTYAALRLPTTYYLLNRVSPFGKAWVLLNERNLYAPVLENSPAVCFAYYLGHLEVPETASQQQKQAKTAYREGLELLNNTDSRFIRNFQVLMAERGAYLIVLDRSTGPAPN